MELNFKSEYNAVYPLTYNMTQNAIITYLHNVHKDIITGSDTGYLSNFLLNSEEIFQRANKISGNNYKIVQNLLDNINDDYHNNFNDEELE